MFKTLSNWWKKLSINVQAALVAALYFGFMLAIDSLGWMHYFDLVLGACFFLLLAVCILCLAAIIIFNVIAR